MIRGGTITEIFFQLFTSEIAATKTAFQSGGDADTITGLFTRYWVLGENWSLTKIRNPYS